MKRILFAIALGFLMLPSSSFAAEQSTEDKDLKEFIRAMGIDEGKLQRDEDRRLALEEADRNLRKSLCESDIESEFCNERVRQYIEEQQTRFTRLVSEKIKELAPSVEPEDLNE